MDYFTDVLAMFPDLDRVMTLAVYGVSEFWKPSDSIKNILICVPKMNGGLTGLEQHDSWQNFHFGGNYPFKEREQRNSICVFHILVNICWINVHNDF